MDGKDYIATRHMSTRLSDGTSVLVAAPGQICEKVAPSSLAWLIDQGYAVRPAAEPSAAPTVTPTPPKPSEQTEPVEESSRGEI